MASTKIPSFVGRSGLTEDELSSLWERLREKWPVAHEVLSGPVNSMEREEAVRWDGPIHDVVSEKYPDVPHYPGRIEIYSDMKLLRGWQRVRAIIDRTYILDEDDYWAARNSPLAFSEQLSDSHQEHLKRLVLAYESAR